MILSGKYILWNNEWRSKFKHFNTNESLYHIKKLLYIYYFYADHELTPLWISILKDLLHYLVAMRTVCLQEKKSC